MNQVRRMRAGSLVSAMTPQNSARRAVPGPVAEKLANEFTPLTGAHYKALALVQALRNGELAPTGPMGWMDVKISLVLVQDFFASTKSPSPPAEMLDTAIKEILRMRAAGMTWGRIAFVTSGANRPGRASGQGKGGG